MFVRVHRGPIPGVARRHLPTKVTRWAGRLFSRFTGNLNRGKQYKEQPSCNTALWSGLQNDKALNWTADCMTVWVWTQPRIITKTPTQKFSRKYGVIILGSFLLKFRLLSQIRLTKTLSPPPSPDFVWFWALFCSPFSFLPPVWNSTSPLTGSLVSFSLQMQFGVVHY